ncbi:MAG: hypothetical protein M1828_001469 [Chrysothrix sp. TS-e1954]|nr:MAG: hypothetical protein M1828_001469 [Chrysothrix sp. TS-e1954]
MSSKDRPDVSTTELISSASSLLQLLERFSQMQNDASSATSTNMPADSPNPMEVLHTAARLLKAHTTKLSLLVINKPYTPSAIRTVLNEIANTCVPAMMSAVQICAPQKYGHFLHDEVSYRVRRGLRELKSMTKEILTQAENVDDGPEDSARKEKTAHRNSLTSTGVVWEACDSLMQFKDIGIVGLVVERVEQHRAMLEDAIQELKEWRDEEEDEGFEDEEDGLEISDGEDSLERLMTGVQKLPHDREDLKQSLDRALQTLKLSSTLYQAVIKRRLKTFISSSGSLRTLDQLLKVLRGVPHTADELANAFYELDNDSAISIIKTIVGMGMDIIQSTRLDWTGQEDQYSNWSDRCAKMLKVASDGCRSESATRSS